MKFWLDQHDIQLPTVAMQQGTMSDLQKIIKEQHNGDKTPFCCCFRAFAGLHENMVQKSIPRLKLHFSHNDSNNWSAHAKVGEIPLSTPVGQLSIFFFSVLKSSARFPAFADFADLFLDG